MSVAATINPILLFGWRGLVIRGQAANVLQKLFVLAEVKFVLFVVYDLLNKVKNLTVFIELPVYQPLSDDEKLDGLYFDRRLPIR